MTRPNSDKTIRRWAWTWLLVCVPFWTGCAAFHPMDGVPARFLPDDLKTPSRSGKETIDLSLLRQRPPAEYLVDAGDVLGIYIEGVLGKREEVPPVRFPQNEEVPPSMGYPIPVRTDGTISIPLTRPMNVRGMTIRRVEETIRQEFTVAKQVLQPGRDRIHVSLQKPRAYQVTVIRQEAGAELTASSSGQINLGALKRGTGRVVKLPAYKNDVLHALAETGGLPGLDAENTIYIIRNGYRTPTPNGSIRPNINQQTVIPQQVPPIRPTPNTPPPSSKAAQPMTPPLAPTQPLIPTQPLPSPRMPTQQNFPPPPPMPEGNQTGVQGALYQFPARSFGGSPPQLIQPLGGTDNGCAWMPPQGFQGFTENAAGPGWGHTLISAQTPATAANSVNATVVPGMSVYADPVAPPTPYTTASPYTTPTSYAAPMPYAASNNAQGMTYGPSSPSWSMPTSPFPAASITPAQNQYGWPQISAWTDQTIQNRNVVKIPVRLGPGQRLNFTEKDIILQDGDVVFIESRDTEIFYTGGLLGGGQFTLPRDYDLDVLGAIAIAQTQGGGGNTRATGGPSALNQDVTISASNAIVVRRLPNGTQLPIKVDLYKARLHPEENILIQPGDYIYLQYTQPEAIAAFFQRHFLETALLGLAAAQFSRK